MILTAGFHPNELYVDLANLMFQKAQLEKGLLVDRELLEMYDRQLASFTEVSQGNGPLMKSMVESHKKGLNILRDEFGYVPVRTFVLIRW